MIVQDKRENMQRFGAIRFSKEQARKSLAMYPGVKMYVNIACIRTFYPTTWVPVNGILRDYRPSKIPEQDFMFEFEHAELNDGDWLVTDKDGKTYIYSDEAFKREFTDEVGDLS